MGLDLYAPGQVAVFVIYLQLGLQGPLGRLPPSSQAELSVLKSMPPFFLLLTRLTHRASATPFVRLLEGRSKLKQSIQLRVVPCPEISLFPGETA